MWRESDGTRGGPAKLAGNVAGDPNVTVVRNASQSWLQVFYEAADHGLWTVWRRADGSWAYPESIRYGEYGASTTATLPNSTTTEVFYVGQGAALRSVWPTMMGAGRDRIAWQAI